MGDSDPVQERIQKLEKQLKNVREHTRQLFNEEQTNPSATDLDDLSASVNLEKHKGSKLFQKFLAQEGVDLNYPIMQGNKKQQPQPKPQVQKKPPAKKMPPPKAEEVFQPVQYQPSPPRQQVQQDSSQELQAFKSKLSSNMARDQEQFNEQLYERQEYSPPRYSPEEIVQESGRPSYDPYDYSPQLEVSRQRSNEKSSERFNERSNERFNERSNERFNERSSERFNERSNERFNERSNERFNERSNERFNERSNDRISDRDIRSSRRNFYDYEPNDPLPESSKMFPISDPYPQEMQHIAQMPPYHQMPVQPQYIPVYPQMYQPPMYYPPPPPYDPMGYPYAQHRESDRLRGDFQELLDKKDNEINNLKRQMEILRADFMQMEERGYSNEGSQNQQELEKQLEETKQELQTVKTRLAKIREAASANTSKLFDLEDQTKIQEHRIMELEQELDMERQQRNQAEGRAEDERQKAIKLESDLQRAENRIVNLDRQLNDARSHQTSSNTQEVDDLRQQISNLNDIIRDLQQGNRGGYGRNDSPRRDFYDEPRDSYFERPRQGNNRRQVNYDDYYDNPRRQQPQEPEPLRGYKANVSTSVSNVLKWEEPERQAPQQRGQPNREVNIVRNLEDKLMQLQIDKQRLDSEYARIPQSNKSAAHRRREQDLELEIDILNSNIASVKKKLRNYNVLK